MLNRCEFLGNMTKDPEIKTTESGLKIASISIAINEKWKDKEGNQQESTEFVNAVAFKNKADILENYTSKGDKIYFSGKMQTQSRDKEDGTKGYRTQIIINKIILLGTKKETSAEENPKQNNYQKPEKKKWTPPPVKKEFEEISVEDIPF